MTNERWKSAVAFLEQHPGLVEGDFSLSWTLGWAHCKQEQFDDAPRCLLQALRLAEGPREESVCHFALGLSYHELSQYEQAEAALRKSLRLRDNLPARLELALLLTELGRSAEAERVHLDGIQLKPSSSERWEAYSAFLGDAGRGIEAQEALTRAHNAARKIT